MVSQPFLHRIWQGCAVKIFLLTQPWSSGHIGVEIRNLLQSCLRLQQFLHFRIMYAELFVITGLLLCLH